MFETIKELITSQPSVESTRVRQRQLDDILTAEFAIAALPAVIAKYGSLPVDAIAEDAWAVADAMMKAKNRRGVSE